MVDRMAMMDIYRRRRARRRARIEAILRAREAARGSGPRPGTAEVDRAREAALRASLDAEAAWYGERPGFVADAERERQAARDVERPPT